MIVVGGEGQDGRLDRLRADGDAFFRRGAAFGIGRLTNETRQEIVDFGSVSVDVHHDGEAGFFTWRRDETAADFAGRKLGEIREIQPETVRPRKEYLGRIRKIPIDLYLLLSKERRVRQEKTQ